MMLLTRHLVRIPLLHPVYQRCHGLLCYLCLDHLVDVLDRRPFSLVSRHLLWRLDRQLPWRGGGHVWTPTGLLPLLGLFPLLHVHCLKYVHSNINKFFNNQLL